MTEKIAQKKQTFTLTEAELAEILVRFVIRIFRVKYDDMFWNLKPRELCLTETYKRLANEFIAEWKKERGK